MNLGAHRRRRGSALILVFWCLILLGMAVFGVVDLVELSIAHASHSELILRARAEASSGLALGLNPQILKDDPLLTQTTGDRKGFKVTIGSEGARLNLNYILLSKHRDILVNLFTQWGMKMVEADRVADCLYDWVTPGDLPSLNGAKADEYARAELPQRPTSLPFTSFDEVKLVMNMDLLEKIKPDWQDSFTLYSNGPLDVTQAPQELIAAIFGIDPKRLQFFTQVRDGKDELPGTADDGPVSDLKTFQKQLGLSDRTIKSLGNQISFSDPVRHVESVGQVQGIQVMISVVTRLNTSPVQYLLWSEQ